MVIKQCFPPQARTTAANLPIETILLVWPLFPLISMEMDLTLMGIDLSYHLISEIIQLHMIFIFHLQTALLKDTFVLGVALEECFMSFSP